MLKTAFIGNRNIYDLMICEWLSEHSDLSLIIWTNRLTWAHSQTKDRTKRVLSRFVKRAKTKGSLRALDEMLYYVLYRRLLAARETDDIKRLVASVKRSPRKPLDEIEQITPSDIKSKELPERIRAHGIDAVFAMCTDAYLPKDLLDAPKLGAYLWHEGITPEYRGVYSPFWALLNRDYANLGFTLLKMNAKLDAGDIYVQGPVRDIDVDRHWHSYIGHKAIVDSLPDSKVFLEKLESNQHEPIQRAGANDGYYSYPTGSGLLRLLLRRVRPSPRLRAR